jgi:diguanylate cyclase (GGDEF)-like protein
MNALRLQKRAGLAAKFNALSIALILITSVGVNTFMIRSEMKNYYNDLLSNGMAIADATAKNCEYGIYTKDREALLRIMEGLSADVNLAYLCVLKDDYNLILYKLFAKKMSMPDFPFDSAEKNNAPLHVDYINKVDGQHYTEILFPVASSAGSGLTDVLLSRPRDNETPKVIGYLRVGLSQEGLRNRIRELLISSVLFTILLVLLGSGLTVFLTRRITAPLSELKFAAQRIAKGNFDAQIGLASNDEIADLANSFDHMLENLRTYRKQVEERTAELTKVNQQLVGEVNTRQIIQEQLKHEAYHDALTGLPNRKLFMDRLGHSIAIAKRRKDFYFGVLFLDIDRFKVINDSLGHTVGDQLLVALGQRLVNCLRPGDTVARLGGDEFVVLLDDTSGGGNAIFVAERIKKAFATPFIVGGNEVFATASIGIALNMAEYEYPEQILRDADTAMYQAKTNGRASHTVFEAGMHRHAVERLRLETDLRKAVEHNEVMAYYQPIVSMKTGRIVGFEALARWRHPERGLINPASFIPVAEETGIIVSIDRLVLKEACLQMRAWREYLPDHPIEFISVNLSNKQMARPDLVDHVAEILNDTGLKPEYLKLEITENVIIEKPELVSSMLAQLRASGVQLYIDDFGTGYSSLSYLHRLPINGFKIDRSFISRLGNNGENQEIVRTILLLARDLKVDVIAEGIETKNQLEIIRSLNCPYWQGFLYSEPVTGEQAKAMLKDEVINTSVG